MEGSYMIPRIASLQGATGAVGYLLVAALGSGVAGSPIETSARLPECHNREKSNCNPLLVLEKKKSIYSYLICDARGTAVNTWQSLCLGVKKRKSPHPRQARGVPNFKSCTSKVPWPRQIPPTEKVIKYLHS